MVDQDMLDTFTKPEPSLVYNTHVCSFFPRYISEDTLSFVGLLAFSACLPTLSLPFPVVYDPIFFTTVPLLPPLATIHTLLLVPNSPRLRRRNSEAVSHVLPCDTHCICVRRGRDGGGAYTGRDGRTSKNSPI
uniref:Uncharacterized protein n=1 Tax=Hordeum vulgare subsp. vulgare TaxID=112509 RepID=A0A8I6Z284_HORVV